MKEKNYNVEGRGFVVTYKYTENEKGITIHSCQCSDEVGTVKVPAVINEKPLRKIEGCAFKSLKCKKLVLPEGKYILLPYALAGSTAQEIYWPKSLQQIPEYCFIGSMVKSIKFEDSSAIFSVGRHAFETTTRLKQLDWPRGVKNIPGWCFQNSSIEILSGTENIFSVDESAFCDSNISKFDFPNVVEIGQKAFKGCTKLKIVDIPDTCELLAKECFSDCPNLYKVENTDKIRWLGEGVFYGSGVESFYWPSRIDEIPSQFFAFCPLKTIDNIDHVSSICEGAFYSTHIDDVYFATLREIGEDAFANATLSKITLPKSCLAIRQGTFSMTKNLKDIYVESEEFEVFLDAFSRSNKAITIHAEKCSSLQLVFPKDKDIICCSNIGEEGICFKGKMKRNLVIDVHLKVSFETELFYLD